MTNSDFIGLAASYAYATGLLVIGEALLRLFGLDRDLTRKLIHVGAGMWVFGVLVLFDRWEIGILPFATFIVINYLFYRYRVIGAMDTDDSSPGTVYFAIFSDAAVRAAVAASWPGGPRPNRCGWGNGDDLGRRAGGINRQALRAAPIPGGAE